MLLCNDKISILKNYSKASNIGLGKFTCAKIKIQLNYKSNDNT
jgi:hypothetical protein